MDEPIEEVYFRWLYSKVAYVERPTPSLTYWTLLRDLHSTEFAWTVLGDDNRAQDGLDLRTEFINFTHVDEDPAWSNIPCSLLEMLIAFARRIEFDTDISIHDLFWMFMQNLGLDDLNDGQYRISHRNHHILERLVWRTYRANGTGGLFPLRNPQEDQRHVELYYQYCAWLVEQER